jgi:hypothetical protein
MSKLNANAKEFKPRAALLNEEEGDDVIFIIRKGKVEEVKLEDRIPRSTEYRLNVMKAEKPAELKVYVNHFFGWTFTQVADFLRSAHGDQMLDILYEEMSQKSHLTVFGALLLYAIQKGVYAYHCFDRTREAFNRFFGQEAEQYREILEREIRWAEKTARLK